MVVLYSYFPLFIVLLPLFQTFVVIGQLITHFLLIIVTLEDGGKILGPGFSSRRVAGFGDEGLLMDEHF